MITINDSSNYNSCSQISPPLPTPVTRRMVSDDEGTVPAPKRAARAAKRADSPVSTVSTAISTAAATVSAVASTTTTATSEGRLRVC